MVPGGVDQLDYILQHCLADMDPARLLPQQPQLLPADHLTHAVHSAAVLPPFEQLQFLRRRGVAHGQPQQEAVQLGVRQLLGAGRAHGILSGNDQKRVRDPVGNTVHRDLTLLHGFQKGGLCAAGGAVQLVGQKEIAEHCAGLVLHFPRGFAEDGKAGDVRGHDVGGELHPAELEIQRPRKGQGQGGFSYAGDIFQQNMSLGQNRRQYAEQNGVLAHDDFFDFRHYVGGQVSVVHMVASFSDGDWKFLE